MQEGVAHLDVNVNVRQGFQFGKVALLCVVGVFQQFYPQAKPTDIDGIGIEVYTEEAVFDNFTLLVEERLLDALAFLIPRNVVDRITVLVGHKQLIIIDVNTVVLLLDSLAGTIDKNAKIIFGADKFIEDRYQEVTGTHSRITNTKGIYNGVCKGIILDVFVFQGLVVLARPAHLFIEAADNGLPNGLAAHIHRDGSGCKYGTVFVSVYFLED